MQAERSKKTAMSMIILLEVSKEEVDRMVGTKLPNGEFTGSFGKSSY